MLSRIFRIHNELLLHIAVVISLEIVLLIGIAFGNFWQASRAIAGTIDTSNAVAYDINKEIDQQRKAATQERYGQDVGENVVEDALQNNEEGPNSKYKVKPNDSIPEKAGKVVKQIKDKGLVDKKTQS